MIKSIAGLFGKLFGSKAETDLKEIKPLLDKTIAVYPQMANLSNDELRAKTTEFRALIQTRIQNEKQEIAEIQAKIYADPNMDFMQKEAMFETIDKIKKKMTAEIDVVLTEILPEVFAVVRETARRLKENTSLEVTATELDKSLAAKRSHIKIEGNKAIFANSWSAAGNMVTWDMVHYDVQLIGGIMLHKGKISEMATGEGKTLVATLPVFLNALSGEGVHIVTVNDYLARRDSEWMGPLYEFHGLRVDCIDKHQPNSDERRNAYAAEITFGTNNEFGFDYV